MPIPIRRVLVVRREAGWPALRGVEIAGTASTIEEAAALAGLIAPDAVLIGAEVCGAGAGKAARAIRAVVDVPVAFASAREGDPVSAVEDAVRAHGFWSNLAQGDAPALRLLGAVPGAMVATDRHGLVQYMNAAAEALTGMRLADAAGRPVRDVYALETASGERPERYPVERSLETEAPTPPASYGLRSASGARVRVLDTAAPVEHEGRCVGAASLCALDTSDADQADLRAFCHALMTRRDEEARAVARQLHDDFCQRTAVLEMEADRLANESQVARAALGPELESIREQARALDAGLRDLSSRLHPSALEHLGLDPALRALADRYRAQGVEIAMRLEADASELPASGAAALYRVANETLRNAARHAPGAPVRVALSAAGAEIELTVEDAGPGFDLARARARGGFGLRAMEERARMAGGSVRIESSENEGATVTARVPRMGT